MSVKCCPLCSDPNVLTLIQLVASGLHPQCADLWASNLWGWPLGECSVCGTWTGMDRHYEIISWRYRDNLGTCFEHTDTMWWALESYVFWFCQSEAEIFQKNLVNTMAADDLVPCVARSSAAIILSAHYQWVLVLLTSISTTSAILVSKM